MNYYSNTMEKSITVEIQDHEILLSFSCDSGRLAFDYWWDTEGKEKFQEWAEKNKKEYLYNYD